MRFSVFVSVHIVVFLLASAQAKGQNKAYVEYIQKYRHLAVAEMHRAGIPASIKMAQALIESNAGMSELATRANNHFGIKCGGDWTGPGYHKEDDDYDASGNLRKSCFRHFRDVEESYVAHSEFLRNPSKVNRYGFLFQLPTTDYSGWAEGLKKAGYATNPNYARTLIRVIEEYKLHELDVQVTLLPGEPLAAKKEDISKQAAKYRITEKVVMNNGVAMVFARMGDTPAKIAERTGVSVKRIIASNEELQKPDESIPYGSRIYLSYKKADLRARASEWHTVKAGESLYQIAQYYGIRLSVLQKRNRLRKGEEPEAGSRINIRRTIRRSEKPRVKLMDAAQGSDKPARIELPQEKPQTTADPVNQERAPEYKEHVVQQGDTLFNIARRYGTTVEVLRQHNQLSGDQIQLGQILRIPYL
jgi:LysM repeat protein